MAQVMFWRQIGGNRRQAIFDMVYLLWIWLGFMRVSLCLTLEHVGNQHGHCPGMARLGERIVRHTKALKAPISQYIYCNMHIVLLWFVSMQLHYIQILTEEEAAGLSLSCIERCSIYWSL